MTNILIPTDFTAASLQLAEQAVQALEVNKATIILFHAFELPASEFDLLVPGRKKPYADLVTDSFRQACKQFKEQYPGAVQKICFKFMEGSSARLFRNFVDANEIDLIIFPDHYHYVSIHKLSVDPGPLFKKSGVKVIREFAPRRKEVVFEAGELLTPVFLTAQ
ncbi:MAG: universal stress protein [Ferruginibacter sp.]